MARGGVRPGAGRKRGSKARFDAEAHREAAASGELPLQYMLRVMRDPKTDRKRKDWAAACAAPYLHARLSAVDQAPPPPDPSGANISALERARRVAFALISGARESSKVVTPASVAPKKKTAETSK